MCAKRVACYLLLTTTVVFSGCLEERGLVGRWDAGRTTFHFRNDGMLFYLTSAKARYQGRYSYDDSTDPGLVRAELQPMNGGETNLSMTLLVTFLGPDRIRLQSPNSRRKWSLIASRMEDRPVAQPEQVETNAASEAAEVE